MGNRVREIQELIPPGQWNHVKTDDNPADLATRDNITSLEGLDFWWEGPKFLKIIWPMESEIVDTEAPAVLAEARKKKLVVSSATIYDERKLGVLPTESISSFGRLLRVTQLVLRVFKKKGRNRLRHGLRKAPRTHPSRQAGTGVPLRRTLRNFCGMTSKSRPATDYEN